MPTPKRLTDRPGGWLKFIAPAPKERSEPSGVDHELQKQQRRGWAVAAKDILDSIDRSIGSTAG